MQPNQNQHAPRDRGVEDLLNAAVRAAHAAFSDAKLTASTLEAMASHALGVVRAQAEAGMWAAWTVVDSRALQGLTMTFEVRRAPALLGGGTTLVPRWDFKDTQLRYLETW